MEKKRIIRDYSKIDEVVKSLVDQQMANEMEFKPLSFNDKTGKKVVAVPVETNDAVYLVKINLKTQSSEKKTAEDDFEEEEDDTTSFSDEEDDDKYESEDNW